MRQAIVTRYLGPTNFRLERIKATASAGSVTVEYEHGLGLDANHWRAALALINRYQWGGSWAGGGTPDGRGNVYVDISGETPVGVPLRT